ncbi:Hap1p SCDLUD_003415 [Saccharomycodes ludwigii]|uniref:Hap1p n=1 Tax=Saccharomycodes ludwigii TaxID=36035 RepID=UPI001E82E638|nr:hypothetical protein SCDLUD_003415 [Saccharomycodes ludwigii]KAH3900434.1 hypothetical protein SCDLUD_003415 [Saccharomycodes ludwigii]
MPPKRKRNRVPLSCTICRKRKVKCDKTRPHCKQCEKTGMSHLCHYMEQSWAEEAEKELSKDVELKELRDRVKSLEEMLNKVHSNNNSPPESITNDLSLTSNSISNSQNVIKLSDKNKKCLKGETPDSKKEDDSKLSQEEQLFSKYDNDELDLTKRFDMLHLKNTGTVHLGATHWLAIMKGDPYLKLLWSHIFTIRERINEWYIQMSTTNNANGKIKRNSIGNCPVGHPTKNAFLPGSNACPVSQKFEDNNDNNTNTSGIPTCPVAHDKNKNISSDTGDAGANRCPIIHNAKTAKTSVNKCPIDHTKLKKPQELPSFDVLSRKCPIMHDKTPTPPPTSHSSYSVGSANNNSVTSRKNSASSSLYKNLDLNSANNEQEIIEKVIKELNKLLPPQRIIALLINKFFKFLYPVIPILDEQSFKSQIAQIIQPPTLPGDNISIKINKPLDCCILGILVIILRLTWLSLPSNGCNIDLGIFHGSNLALGKLATNHSAFTASQAKDENLILKFEIPTLAVNLIRKYLVRFDEISSFSNKNVNITTVQFAIFYKIYLISCPESSESFQNSGSFMTTGHDNETHQVLLSSIVQMAFSCGLHRDPDNFPQLNTDVFPAASKNKNENSNSNGNTKKKNKQPSTGNAPVFNKEVVANTERLKHTWRKTWFFIVSLDVQQSLSLGAPRLLRNLGDFSDTKLPCASKIDYVSDIKELIVVKNYTLFFQIDLCIIAVLNHILNVSLSRSVRKFELDELISILKKLSYGEDDNNSNINDIVNTLINKGLLFTSEATALNTSISSVNKPDDYDSVYTLPTLKKILYSTSDGLKDDSSTSNSKKLDLPHETTTKAVFFSKHLTIRMLLYLLSYILFTNYEPMGNDDADTIPLSRKYAQDSLNYAMDGFRNSLVFFINTKSQSGGNGSIFNYMEVLLTPSCLDVCHRALQFMICLILRARCGPLAGISECPIITTTTTTENSSSGSEDETSEKTANSNNTGKKGCPYSGNSGAGDSLFDNNEVLQMSDDLANILLCRMELFHKLTKQISEKYTYASKMTRSTGFFLTLLKTQSSKNKTRSRNASTANESSAGNNNKTLPTIKTPGIANMARFFKNIPSLIISAGGEQLKRCPVYQDAIGFLPIKSPNLNSGNVAGRPPQDKSRIQAANTSAGGRLSKIKTAYNPITYRTVSSRTSDIRRGSEEIGLDPLSKGVADGNNDPVKRRKLSSDIFIPSSEPPVITPKTRMFNDTLPLPNTDLTYITNNSNAATPLTDTVNVRPQIPVLSPNIKMKEETPVTLLATPNLNSLQASANLPLTEMPNATSTNAVANGDNTQFLSPSILSEETSSSINYTPDFEEFLKQNADLTGLIINPSSIVEAVGFDHEYKETLFNVGGIKSRKGSEVNSVWNVNEDFIDMENTGIEGLSEIIHGRTSTGNVNDNGVARNANFNDMDIWE